MISPVNTQWFNNDMALCFRFGFKVYCIPRSDFKVWVEMDRKGRKKRLPNPFEQNGALWNKIADLYRQEAEKLRIRITEKIKENEFGKH